MNFFSKILNRPTSLLAQLGLRSFIMITILATAEVLVFGVSYFVTVLLPRSWEKLHITEAEVGVVVAVFGGVSLLCQLPAGVLADRYSNKMLILVGLVSAALSLFWFALLVHFGGEASATSLFYQYIVICVFWGISTSLFFWTPMQRLVSQQASKDNQGLAYNLSNSTNGIVGTIFIWALAVGVIALIERYKSAAYFAYYIYLNCILIILIAIVIQIIFKQPKTVEKTLESVVEDVAVRSPSQSSAFSKIVKSWKMWALSFGVLAIVVYGGILSIYLKDFLSGTLMIPAIWVSIFAGLRFFVAKLSILPFAKKINRLPSFILALTILQLVAGLTLLPFILLPGFSTHPASSLSSGYLLSLQIFLGILFVLTGFIYWLMVSMQFTQVVEVERPPKSYGLTIAFIAMIAYSSRAWFTPIVSSLISANQIKIDGETFTSWNVYQIVFAISMLISLLASLVTLIVYLSNKRELKRLGKTSFRWRNLENM